MIELSVSLASNGVVKVPGYEQLVCFGYTKNRGVYRLHVDATGEWAGLAIRCFWHVPDSKDPASSLVVDGYVDVPASVTAQPGSGCITFEGSDGTKTVTSADLRYRVSANSGTEDGATPEPGTPAWQQLVDAVHTDATAAEQAKIDAQTAAQQATTSAGNADQSAQEAADSLQELKDGIASGDFKGEPGNDGKSPVIAVTDIENGHRVSITDKDGTKTIDVLNGQTGKTGATPVLTIGTVSSGDKPSADISGTPENPVLNLRLQPGPQGPAVALDTTLTHEGEAADAKATGDAIQGVRGDLVAEAARAKGAENQLKKDIGNTKTQLSESITEISKNVFAKLGTKYVVTQSKTSEYDIALYKGNYVFSQSELGTTTTVVLYNTDTYQSGNPDNLKVWDNAIPTSKVPLVVDVSLPKDYKHIHIWQALNTNVVLTIEQIGSVTKHINAIDDRLGLTGGLEKVAFEWSQYLFDGMGSTANVHHTDAISTPKLYGNGLYIITFPDELVATYNAVNHEKKRQNFESFHPFSYFCNDFVRVYFKRKDGGELLPTSKIVNEIKILRLSRKMSEYDVTVCASDTNPYKKEKADIVLNGDNDTEILSALFGCYNSITVFLFNGTYNINKMYTYSDTAKIALPFNTMNYDGGSGYRRYITVIGESYSTPQTLDSVKFVVSEKLHNSLANSGINYFVIGTPYSKDNSTIGRMATSCVLRNINIIGHKYDKPITYVDTTRCLSTMIDSVNIRSWEKDIATYHSFEETPNAECCGIRVGRGSNYGIQNFVKHSNVWYCGIGVACNGEHFIFEDVKTHHDYIGFVFGDRNTVGHQEHPNILIGCSIEGCYRLMILTKSGVTVEQDYTSEFYRSTLVMIGTSTELNWYIPLNEIVGDVTSKRTLPIKEIIKGAWRGRIEIDSDKDVFENGSGQNFAVTKY